MRGRNRTFREIERRRRLGRLVEWTLALGVLFWWGWTFVFGDQGLLQYFAMKRAYLQLEVEIQRLEAENQRLARQIEALRSDPEAIERLAREQLGLVREGEIVYQFIPPERP